MSRDRRLAGVCCVLSLFGCELTAERPPPPPHDGIYGFADKCVVMDATEPRSRDTRWLERNEAGDGFTFTGRELDAGSRWFMKASGLGTYLFYDKDGGYLVAEGGRLAMQQRLRSDVTTQDDSYVSGAQWELQLSAHDEQRLQLRNLAADQYLRRDGSLSAEVADAAVIALYPASGCTEHPELSLDAEGEVAAQRFDDGSVFGIVDTHSHMLTNFAFGAAGTFHGAPFHPLGVAHALPDCALFHGVEGRRDLLGFAYDQGAAGDFSYEPLLPALIFGQLSEFNHHTAGYPDFTAWPNAAFSSTHQAQYYRWLERAWLGGLRLVVQHATSNSVLCDLVTGQGIQQRRYACNDMVAVDRSIDEAYNLQDYIDAQAGGPGLGWFRIVGRPAEARAVIDEGKLAVILGIEVSNLFDCFLVPREGFPTCDAAHIVAQLEHYRQRGVRAIFPVHKYDNGFSAGDGHRAVSEFGSFVNSGHWSSFTQDCPGIASVFDKGGVQLGGLNMPRTDYFSPPPVDMSGFADAPVSTVLPYLEQVQAPPLEGDYCQSHGLTSQGETLIREMMRRGMIIEVDHLPQRSYQRAFEILEANDYPLAATHGTTYDGRVYALGGVSKTGLGRCADPDRPEAMADRLRSRIELITAMGGYPAEGFGFDLNGFAGAPGPRFGERSDCATPQENPISYPFQSYAGDVTFHEPRLGRRVVDFNTEGLVHIGMLPELIEDARRTGVSDADLEPLFRSAEGYLRMWERAEARARSLR